MKLRTPTLAACLAAALLWVACDAYADAPPRRHAARIAASTPAR